MKIEKLINKYRVDHGLAEFKIDDQLCLLAKERLVEIGKEFKHDIPIDKCLSCSEMGENLARGFNIDENVLDAWIKSPSHNRLLLANYQYSCVEHTDGRYVLLMSNKVLGAEIGSHAIYIFIGFLIGVAVTLFLSWLDGRRNQV